MNWKHILLVAALVFGCDAATQAPEMPTTPWALEDASQDTPERLRVLIIHDMEGLSGQDDPSTFFFGTDLYPTGQKLLAADINAVVDGLYAGGATEVVIADGHGSGSPDPDLSTELLDPRATQIFSRRTVRHVFRPPRV